jgi:hypothetical protein
MERAAATGVVENGISAVHIRIARRELIDRRSVGLTKGLPTHPLHHEGSGAVGCYLNAPWARSITLPRGSGDSAMYREARADAAKARGWAACRYERDRVVRDAAKARGAEGPEGLLRAMARKAQACGRRRARRRG